MIETEVKILEINKTDIIKKLEGIGAKQIYHGKIFSVVYDINGAVLRIRRFLDSMALTYKSQVNHKSGTCLKKRSKYKAMDEIEVTLGDFTKARKIFNALGYKEKAANSKFRISYNTADAHFDLDKIKGIPIFMEIEAKPAVIKKYLKLFDIDNSKVKPWNTKNLLDYYNNKKKA
jgi:predicted adenylyl cyclase CyaB